MAGPVRVFKSTFSLHPAAVPSSRSASFYFISTAGFLVTDIYCEHGLGYLGSRGGVWALRAISGPWVWALLAWDLPAVRLLGLQPKEHGGSHTTSPRVVLS